MNLREYDLVVKPGSKNFEFISEGPKGRIKKVIEFKKIDTLKNTYNLGFGDYVESLEEIDDHAVTNNGDSEKILFTVASAVMLFTNKYPSSWIFITGSTPSRIRYYVMKISKFIHQINGKFEIWGSLNEIDWELFRPNRSYRILLAKKK